MVYHNPLVDRIMELSKENIALRKEAKRQESMCADLGHENMEIMAAILRYKKAIATIEAMELNQKNDKLKAEIAAKEAANLAYAATIDMMGAELDKYKRAGRGQKRKMDRLTVWDDFYGWCVKGEIAGNENVEKAIKRLAELEDMIESGELVEVVQCKDCKKYQTSMCTAKHERALMDFCSCGEREGGLR